MQAMQLDKPTTTMLLANHQIRAYQRDGFLILPKFIEPSLCNMLRQHAQKLTEEFTLTKKVIFSTVTEQHANQAYFLDSGDKIHFFFEEKGAKDSGKLSLNKIGHALHDLDPIFYAFSRMHKLARLAAELNIVDPLLVQSMYIFKQPFVGGEVLCHQDGTYLYAEPDAVTGLWFALDDATIDNGCLWAIPSGHREHIKVRFIRNTNNETHHHIITQPNWSLENMIPLEVPKGSVIVLHGHLPHMSKENTSAKSREAYTLHLLPRRSHFAADNWLKRSSTLPFKGFMG